MAVSPDSHWLATGGEDRRIILWDLTAPDPSVAYAVLRSPTGSGTGVQVAFSADGRWLSAFGSAAFSSEAPWLVTADNDVHLFNLPVDEVIDRICLAVGRNPTEEGWQRYAPDLPAQYVLNKAKTRWRGVLWLNPGSEMATSEPSREISTGQKASTARPQT